MKLQSVSDFTFHSVLAYVKNTRAEKSLNTEPQVRMRINTTGVKCQKIQRDSWRA